MYSGAYILYGVRLERAEVCAVLGMQEGELDRTQILTCAGAWYMPWVAETAWHRQLRALGCPGLRLFGLPCCLCRQGPLFLGAYVGELVSAYRSNIEEHADLDAYIGGIEAQLARIRARADAIAEAKLAIGRLMPDAEPAVYSYVNDCDSCT